MASSAKQIHEIIPDLKWLWNETPGDPDICIAIIDGQVNKNHPALTAANFEILETYTGISNGRKGVSSHHGTHIASVIFGQHDSMVKGIAPHCKGLSLPVFYDDANGNVTPCSQLDLARTITQATEAGAHIINISGGELNNSGEAHPLLAKAARQCAERNVLIVTAAGNDGCACLHIPGALPSVLVVGGMNSKGDPLEFSNWGAAYRAQGILAPGEDIPGAIGESEVGMQTGTSFATAIVSGIAALLLSIQKKRGEPPDPATVRRALLDSADGCNDWQTLACQRLLKGRLDVKKAYSIIHSDKKQNMEILSPNQDLTHVTELVSSPEERPVANGVTLSGVVAGENQSVANAPQPVVLKNNAPLQGVMPSCGGDESCSCGSFF